MLLQEGAGVGDLARHGGLGERPLQVGQEEVANPHRIEDEVLAQLAQALVLVVGGQGIEPGVERQARGALDAVLLGEGGLRGVVHEGVAKLAEGFRLQRHLLPAGKRLMDRQFARVRRGRMQYI